MAYAWSGYGAGILGNLKDAVLSAETIFGDFLENAITVAKKIKDIHEVFDAAVEEDCIFQCPSGITHLPLHRLFISLTKKLNVNLEKNHHLTSKSRTAGITVYNYQILLLFFYYPGVTPKPDRSHVPTSDGCGSLGINVRKIKKIS